MRSVVSIVLAAVVVLALALGVVLAPVARAETTAGPPTLGPAISRGEGEILKGIVQRNQQARALMAEADELWKDVTASASARLSIARERLADVKPNDKGELCWAVSPAAAPVTSTTKK